MVFRSAGLKRPRIAPAVAERVPPGQFLTERWPVLHFGSVPKVDLTSWDFRVFGLVERELCFTWEEFLDLPRVTVTADMHCVSRWSTLDHAWEGVSARQVMTLAGVNPEAAFVLLYCDGGYTTNLPIEAVNDTLFALKHDGEDLSPEHGYPLRAVAPNRYAWKSAKWIRAVGVLAEDRPGFWEQHGYNNNADFWQEERFAE